MSMQFGHKRVYITYTAEAWWTVNQETISEEGWKTRIVKHARPNQLNHQNNPGHSKAEDFSELNSMAPKSKDDVPWADRHKPRHLGEVVGNTDQIRKLAEWLRDWDDVVLRGNKKEMPAPPTDNIKKFQPPPDNMNARAALVSGPPGIGKTTTCTLVARCSKFKKVMEFNASDARSKSVIDNMTSSLSGNMTLSFGGSLQRSVIIMDECDGMTAGDLDLLRVFFDVFFIFGLSKNLLGTIFLKVPWANPRWQRGCQGPHQLDPSHQESSDLHLQWPIRHAGQGACEPLSWLEIQKAGECHRSKAHQAHCRSWRSEGWDCCGWSHCRSLWTRSTSGDQPFAVLWLRDWWESKRYPGDDQHLGRVFPVAVPSSGRTVHQPADGSAFCRCRNRANYASGA